MVPATQKYFEGVGLIMMQHWRLDFVGDEDGVPVRVESQFFVTCHLILLRSVCFFGGCVQLWSRTVVVPAADAARSLYQLLSYQEKVALVN